MFDHIAQPISYQHIELPSSVHLDIKRIDLIHPQISGNKFFKLKYNLLAAKQQGLSTILTFGGAYSNHIAATAYTAHLFGLHSIGIIRGEELANKPLNPTLEKAQILGMQLHFVSRNEYRLRNNENYLQQLHLQFPETFIIPEGGTNELAVQGCQEILSQRDLEQYDVICCAVGTGGTISGLIERSAPHQKVLGFSALKGDFLQQEIQQWTKKQNWSLTDAYCCGGYAKTSPELFAFIESFEAKYAVPLEPIYTGKMMFGLFDLIKNHYFPEGTRILAIHSGGLQADIRNKSHQ
ncbi:1-aminocyclopropane-1-carboxylate deaminase/D-cysteine desulfhydrase [Acinetobacter seifertii]|uniref:1-aminocyclopropane-1-carboxylate deaminase/D-cysteine desulfhydrase n=2 Tax=Acinetobacter TaxID=469 RepID=A0A7H2ULN7_9GAMM|nr:MULTISPECIES: pyridoxal-phosphate dependent enzyme [Acinetobacter]MDQ9038660.1 pyridoxal-phosphate dependent enzyme [Acinetobacter seifertii]ONN52600.1 1-aminocyclopropane-1-carboxylate deaminase [Acinetobacter genomosp. 33YU]QNX20484.1 1-aminocyclopropane-1-carboxylate deaminase/D-cysteine desulfhydrase [Acinetobacter seifertii]QNX27062.1 1-aminocyclopropane-1-carboxylate deaminase/D-cysteine desulfhydrase [Acinetobacter seifertii]QNX29674.1 1-aminocyclopropane-1-carboxylate deaminase/D-cy